MIKKMELHFKSAVTHWDAGVFLTIDSFGCVSKKKKEKKKNGKM